MKNRSFNRKIILLSTVLTLSGLWLTLDNLYRYSIGYYAVQTTSQQVSSAQVTDAQVVDKQITDKLVAEAQMEPQVEEKPYKGNDNSAPFAYLSKLSDRKPEVALYATRPAAGDRIGELSIPKLNAVLPIYEGTEESELDKGVGHFSDSVLPGEKDNSVLSGHRDTVFRKLGEVGVGDSLLVQTSAGEFTFKVYKVRIVDKDDRTVIVPKPKETLTISTCYPFDFIGAAPKRFVLVAYLESKILYDQD